jgi:intergrase/recombinase
MTEKQLNTARKIIKKHYGLDRTITNQEVMAEINNLARKYEDKLFMVPGLLIKLEIGLKINHIMEVI